MRYCTWLFCARLLHNKTAKLLIRNLKKKICPTNKDQLFMFFHFLSLSKRASSLPSVCKTFFISPSKSHTKPDYPAPVQRFILFDSFFHVTYRYIIYYACKVKTSNFGGLTHFDRLQTYLQEWIQKFMCTV